MSAIRTDSNVAGLAISDWLYNCAAAEFNRTLGGVISRAA
jgi:hypothetical protein